MTGQDPTVVDPTDREAVRRNLERFAGADAVTEREDGSLVADFRGVTHVTVRPDGRIETGMPLHEFAGAPDRLVFDHDAGELRAEGEAGGVAYTFRRP
ncbi:hypothetical protein [Halosimplex salinum]|uniref:hypothetical protein n=1 Tax=Halosimplex salinum TaxID=1710538 RepID=UPI000F4718BB|nr:hypothetical protein [Halosimplex salinum]